jgi:hypothetical protein
VAENAVRPGRAFELTGATRRMIEKECQLQQQASNLLQSKSAVWKQKTKAVDEQISWFWGEFHDVFSTDPK